MIARDIMTSPAIVVDTDADTRKIAQLLLEKRISAVPVVDQGQKLVGIVSEGDLMWHAATGTGSQRRRSWWLKLFDTPEAEVRAYAKSHGHFAHSVMSRNVITAADDATLPELAALLEEHRIKRVPIVRDERVVGIVSRANLLHALACTKAPPVSSLDDATLRSAVNDALAGASFRVEFNNVIVADGVVHLWGAVDSEETFDAVTSTVTDISGVQDVRNHISVFPLVILA